MATSTIKRPVGLDGLVLNTALSGDPLNTGGDGVVFDLRQNGVDYGHIVFRPKGYDSNKFIQAYTKEWTPAWTVTGA